LDNEDSPGISFKGSLKAAHRLLSTGDYGVEEGIIQHPPIHNRSLKVLCGYYAISRYTGHSMDLLEYLLASESKKKRDKGTGQYGIVVQALCEVILFGSNPPEGDEPLPTAIDPIAFVNGCHNIRLKYITDRVMFDVMNSDDSTCRLVIDRGTVNYCLERLRIPIKEGAARYKYIDDSNPEFLETLAIAIKQYAPDYLSIFARVLPKSEEVMKVKVVKTASEDVSE
jgi:hypothetical protein